MDRTPPPGSILSYSFLFPPADAARTQETSRRGASTALGSMAPTAQAVFRLIAETQLDDPASPGMTFPALFRMCRERWLVSSEQVWACV